MRYLGLGQKEFFEALAEEGLMVDPSKGFSQESFDSALEIAKKDYCIHLRYRQGASEEFGFSQQFVFFSVNGKELVDVFLLQEFGYFSSEVIVRTFDLGSGLLPLKSDAAKGVGNPSPDPDNQWKVLLSCLAACYLHAKSQCELIIQENTNG